MLEIMTNPDLATFWSALGAITQALAIILSVVALLYTVTIYRATMQSAHYTELDAIYMRLLEMAMDRPHLRRVNADRSPDEILEYDSYAFMVWNFLETVYDRSLISKHLRETWYPILKTEKNLHGEWLSRPENRENFKDDFLLFMESSQAML